MEGCKAMDISKIKLDFDPVSLKDWEIIQQYLVQSAYEESNHNIVNMMLWLKG